MIKELAKKYGEELFCQKRMPAFGGPDEELFVLEKYYRGRSQHQRMVDSFHRQANLIWRSERPVNWKDISDAERVTRAMLIMEEAIETVEDGLGIRMTFLNGSATEASNYVIEKPLDAVALVDGCFDLRVVTTGTLSQFGIPDCGQVFVDRNNLLKCTEEGAHINENGKLVKSPNHVSPEAELAAWLETIKEG